MTRAEIKAMAEQIRLLRTSIKASNPEIIETVIDVLMALGLVKEGSPPSEGELLNRAARQAYEEAYGSNVLKFVFLPSDERKTFMENAYESMQTNMAERDRPA